jgi:putative FmdB family regulatory protein
VYDGSLGEVLMPTYVYECNKCGDEFELYQSFSDDPLKKHPGCGGKVAKVFQPVGIVLKGSGFYKNDSRGGGKRSNGGPAKSDSGTSEKSDSSKSSKSDPGGSNGSGSSSNGDSSSSKKKTSESSTTSAKSS